MLTERIVQAQNATGNTYLIWDAKLKGLGLRVSEGGAKSYIAQGRDKAKRSRRVTLGRAVDMSLKEARSKATDALAAIQSGVSDKRQVAQTLTVNTSVAEALDVFFAAYVPARVARGRMAESTVRVYRTWSRHLRDELGPVKVRDVTRSDLETLALKHTSITGNRIVQFTSVVFNWLEREDLIERGSNPTAAVERARELPRERVLSPSELKRLSDALKPTSDNNPTQVAAIRLTMYCGLRIGEVLSLRWANVDLETGRALIEGKSGPRVYTLPRPAVDVLLAIEHRISDYCFAAVPNTRPAYKSVRLAFAKAVKAAKLRDVRLHDLRRTVLTQGANLGLSAQQLRSISGHTSTRMLDRYVQQAGALSIEAREMVAAAMGGYMSRD